MMKHFFEGMICGLLNGFFGSGGGVAAVPIIEHEQRLIQPELSPADSMKHAHADSVALIFVLMYLICSAAASTFPPHGATFPGVP